MPVREEAFPIAPPEGRSTPLPAWGMGDAGRRETGVVEGGGHRHGGGSPRLVSFSVSSLDAALLVAGLLIWTVLFVLFFSPQ
jgi:hypothetical protein